MVDLSLIRPNLSLSSIIFTQRCNIDCRICFIPQRIRRFSPKPNLKTLKIIIDSFGALKEVKQLGISGGEPFLFFDDLAETLDYGYKNYGLEGTVNTNAFWATTPKESKKKLEHLYQSGLRYIGVSADSFHQEFVPIKNIFNLIIASTELSIMVFVQTVKGLTTWNKRDVEKLLGGYASRCEQILDTNFTITSSAKVEPYEIPTSSEMVDGCSILRLIQSDQIGNIRFCCGPTEYPTPAELIAGNIFDSDLNTIIEKASTNPFFNSLYVNAGPTELMRLSDRIFGTAFLTKKYTSCCDACNQLLQSSVKGKLFTAIADNAERYYILRKYKEEVEKDSVISE